ncbi:MAG: HlyD family efflux transporter periplasmic adaptor subunit [Candidatus Sumerlaeia bacterium]|nr:HlyD family efflux transporter periplasmic adaptor subunit [Candidatus Sumerlaeia bacterium]
MKKIVPILVLLTLGSSVYFYQHKKREGIARRQITFSGNIELTEVHLAFKRAGRLECRLADEGDSVTSGAVLARLDTAELERQRERAEAAVAIAESRLTMLDSEIRLLEETLAAQLDSRRAELEQAKAVHRELATGSRKQEIAEAEAAVERLKTEMEQARRDLERIQGLFASGVAPASQRDAAQTRYEAAQASLKQAEEYLALVREGPRSEKIEAAQAAVARSEAAVRAVRASEIELELKKLERPIRYAELQKARAELALIDTQLADSVLKAPMAGVVLSKAAEPGEVLAAGTPVLTLGDLDRPWVRGYIGEKELDRVHLGDKVIVRSDSGKTYEGRVSFIASEAEFTPKQIQTREERTKFVYRIKVDLPNPNRELKLNMPVEGEVVGR